jgi:hypothetical protein
MKNREPDPDEREPRRKHYVRCRDRMCGANDCPTCRPGNFKNGSYVDDLKDEKSNEENEK